MPTKMYPPIDAFHKLPVEFDFLQALEVLARQGPWRTSLTRVEGVYHVLRDLETRGWVIPQNWIGWRKNLSVQIPPYELDFLVLITPGPRSFSAKEFGACAGWPNPWQYKKMLDDLVKTGYIYKETDANGEIYYRRTRAGNARVEQLVQEGFDLAALKKAIK